MTKSDAIRSLARQGLPVADIARQIGVRYQHAYNVLKQDGLLDGRTSNVALVRSASKSRAEKPEAIAKPALTINDLIAGGFSLSARWLISEGTLRMDKPMPKERGVYAFVMEGRAVYVGLATMGLAKRLYFYGKPGATQKTSLRLNALLQGEIGSGSVIDIYTAMPPNLRWNGLPVSGDAGLELGLIETFDLSWNIRGARPMVAP